ncbi:histidine phosphatase family protein [Nonomuraea cavernae]|uniref:histidine phosphatase family protein n=1 Tax=Nonomuraea cavernae TaxID=2045107 RepID=UPI00340E4DAA
MAETTVVHLMRHGEVHNPGGILYGRLPGYHLSETGRLMAETVAKAVAGRDVVALYSSPLERALETAAPLAATFGLEPEVDDRLIEAGNMLEGRMVGQGLAILRNPRNYRYFYNPMRPSWGEPYPLIIERMRAVVDDARKAARGHEVVLVSHQLPIWTIRMAAEGRRRFVHDPRRRQCGLASLTTFTFDGDRLVSVGYSEPAGSLAQGPTIPGA